MLGQDNQSEQIAALQKQLADSEKQRNDFQLALQSVFGADDVIIKLQGALNVYTDQEAAIQSCLYLLRNLRSISLQVLAKKLFAIITLPHYSILLEIDEQLFPESSLRQILRDHFD
jgi:hypothetical protein